MSIPRHLTVVRPWLREAVLARDGWQCRYCQRKLGRGPRWYGKVHIDHVYPVSRGGETVLENLVTACWRCNTAKGDRTPSEARMRLLPSRLLVGIMAR